FSAYGQVVLRHADEARTGERAGRGLRHRIDVVGQLLASELPAELDGPLRGGSVGEAPRRVRFREHLRAVDVVVFRRTAEVHGRDLFQFLERVHRGDVVRARHRERGVAAELTDVPRQVLAAVAALDDAVLPVVLQHLGGDARRARVRERAEIADAGVNVELAVRRDAHQAVEAVESGRVISLADADAGDRRSLALPAALAALVPVEALGTFRERFLQVHARD